MATTSDESGWILAFDWQEPGAEERARARLTSELLPALLDRERVDPLDAPDSLRRFGAYIAGLRQASDWTRVHLARQAGIDPLAVLLLERAELSEAEVTPELVSRLARAFSIPVEELVVNPLPQPEPGPGPWERVKSAFKSMLVPVTAAPAPALLRSSLGVTPAAAGSVLDGPVPLPPQSLALRDGRRATAQRVLEPPERPEPGVADLHVRLLDEQDRPIAGVVLDVDVDGLFYAGDPTDAQGVARIAGLPIDENTPLELLALREP